MEKEKVHYKETQSMWWFVTLFGLLAVWVVLAGIFKWGTHPIPLSLAFGMALLFILICLAFYQLKIVVTTTKVKAYFGVGWLKKQFDIDQLDTTKARTEKLPWYYGIGYRISPKGVFLNTKPGPALYIPTKDGRSAFFVGTTNAKKIITVLSALSASAK